MELKETGFEDVCWVPLVQVNVQWQAFVNVVMNLWISLKMRNFLTS
jgi:hypothetical protein